MEKKLVSIIIPTFSRPNNLCRAIDSVLQQTYKNIEIIVVDDNGKGSYFQELTKKTIQHYIDSNEITYISHPKNMNGSAARNTGLANSHGEYIAFLDDDDIYAPSFISESINALYTTESNIGASYCNSNWILNNGKVIKKNNTQSGNIIEAILLRKCTCSTSCILFKKNVLVDLNGFDINFKRHQDWELLIRFFRKYKILLIQKTLITKYTTNTKGSNILDAMEMFKIKSLFFEVYKKDIENLSERNAIYSLHWKEIAFLLARQGYIKKSYSTFKYANSFQQLSINDHIIYLKKILLSFVYRK